MSPARSVRSLTVLMVTLLVAAATPGVIAQEEADEGQHLPVPQEETPTFPVNATARGGAVDEPIVVLTWPVQEEAAEYEVWVNPDTEERPTWTQVNVTPELDPDENEMQAVHEDPPEPRNGRETISYAVLALDDEGNVVAQGRAAVGPDGLEWPPRLPFEQTEEEASPATTTGTLVGLVALAAIAIAVLAYLGYKRRGR